VVDILIASSACPIIGLPATGCNTFGRLDFMRVPCPAASRMAVIFMCVSSVRTLPPSFSQKMKEAPKAEG
jgi:hypothetical protein